MTKTMQQYGAIKQQITSLDEQIAALEADEYMIETNQGTYGAAEARRKVGCGDPHFANRDVYETVGGTRRERGPDEADAPGRMRKFANNVAELKGKRKTLNAMRKERRELQRQYDE